MNDKKKKYAKPEADVVDFDNSDIITLSAMEANDADWTGDDNMEEWA